MVPRNEKRTEEGRYGPTGKTAIKNTGTVLLCSLVIGACIWIFDGVAVLAVKTLIGLFTH